MNKTEKDELKRILKDIPDIYTDFYITKNNLRLSIKENINIVLSDVTKGDLMFYTENAVALICGIADKFSRKYLKVLSKSKEDLELLLNIVYKEYDGDLYAKLKKDNEMITVFLDNQFDVFKNRGKEILLFKKGKQ